MTVWLIPVVAAGYGLGSALLPVFNAEVYAAAAADRGSLADTLLVVVTLAVGQTAGKLLLHEAARRGSSRFAGKASPRWSRRLSRGLGRRRTAVPLVLTSAVLGLPPLAAVSLAAGAAGQRRGDFATACLVGRVTRFALIALPVLWAVG